MLSYVKLKSLRNEELILATSIGSEKFPPH